jgi:Cys-tRNA(Pro) deacylase
MLTSPAFPGRFLVELPDLAAVPPAAAIRDGLEPLRRTVAWAENYLCQPHARLGRSGPVCPYALASMRKRAFRLALCRGRDFAAGQLEEILLDYRDWFLALEPREGIEASFKTILILFPDLERADVPRLIDATQVRLRPEYVARGLMLGEFHDGPPPKAGLWNPDFRPLASPVPMLVIRHMVPTDFAFLKQDRGLVASYVERFRGQIPQHLRDEVIQVAFAFGIELPTAEEMAAVHPRVAAALLAAGVPFVVHRHRDLPAPPRGPADVAAALGYEVDRISKALFLRCRCHGQYAIAVCSVLRKVDLGLLARHLGCKRLELASLQEVGALLGYSTGGVSPIGGGGFRVLMDERLFAFPTILSAAGEIAVEIEVDPRRLRDLTSAEVLAFGAEPEAAGRVADSRLAGPAAPGAGDD